jgi:hypothetical protein
MKQIKDRLRFLNSKLVERHDTYAFDASRKRTKMFVFILVVNKTVIVRDESFAS